MPELAEVEAYRRLAESAIGRPVAEVVAPDAWYLKRGLTSEVVRGGLQGRRLTRARRVGKLLLLDTDDGAGPWPEATGLLMSERRPGGICPKDGAPLVRRTVGGRTTWSCPRHQG